MKAEELRIGNWIHDTGEDGGFYQVDGIYPPSNGFEYYSISYRNGSFRTILEDEEDNYIQPIPLTEEWLVKFGGVIDREDDSYVFKSGLYVSVNYKSEAILFFNGIELCEFNYVHQLQNRYFALTNKELKLKQNESI